MISHKKVIIPTSAVRRTAPINLRAEDEIYFQHEYQKTFPPVHLWSLKNVNVTSEGVVYNQFGIFKPSLVSGSLIPKYGLRYFLSNYIKKKKVRLSKKETYVLVLNEWSNGYFHWMCDSLPRLTSIKNILTDCIILLPETTSSRFIKESLKVFSYKDIQIIPSNSYLAIPNLILPEHIAPTGNYNIDIMYDLQKLFLNSVKNEELSLGDKIYVSRKKAAYRYVLNEEEVFDLVEQYGFKKVFFEDYSMQEQISIMKNANYLIGVIGANLVNMMFMKPDSFVLQFTTKNNMTDNCYFSLANAFNHNFLYQFCDYVNTRPGAYWNLHVDIVELKRNLNIIFTKK